MRTRRLHVLIISAALVVWSQVSLADEDIKQRHISNSELAMEKSGRIVDADTKTGVSGAKIIVNWRTTSTGIPGYSSTGGTWCDLQRVVATNESGDFTVPDVSRDLDLSDRGTRRGKTAFGVASATHDKDYALAVFRPGYVRVGDMETVKQEMGYERRNLVSALTLQTVPSASISAGRVVIAPIAIRKFDLSWSDLWAYYRMVPLACEDRTANSIDQPETQDILQTMRATIRPMPCAMEASTAIDAQSFGAFASLVFPGNDALKVIERIKQLGGAQDAGRFDPQEAIATTAGTLCRAIQEQDAAK
jgi:hypothetical protein